MAMESQVTALFGDLRALKDKLVNALGMAPKTGKTSGWFFGERHQRCHLGGGYDI